MTSINLFGEYMTLDEAKAYLKSLKTAYEANIDKRSFVFDRQEMLTAFAKYTIEYLEHQIEKS